MPSKPMPDLSLSPMDEARLESEVGPPGFWYETQDFQINFLKRQGLRKDQSLLDIGCGVLRGGLPLITYLQPGRYTGVDVRPSAINTANDLVTKFGLSTKKPILAVSENYGAEFLDKKSQDVIFIFQVLYHLEDDLAKNCLHASSDLLKNDGVIFANVHCDNVGKVGKWKEFPFLSRALETYENWAELYGLSMTNMGRMKEHDYPLALGGCENFMLRFEAKK